AGRREAGRFLAEGAQAVREALRAPDVVVELFATAEASARHRDIVGTAVSAGIRVDEISVKAAAALSETVTPQGLVAVCRAIDVPLTAALDRRPPLVAALVETNDPGNAGTILRTADAAGAGAVVLAGTGVDPYNGKAVRASAGSLFHLDVVAGHPVDDLVPAARRAGYCVLATTGGGTASLFDLDADLLGAPTLWLFGNEAHGLPPAVLAAADLTVSVPILGRAESLNLAAAAAVCLYASARAHSRRG
ncbi:MAG: TrmH family RNA methyltransferase, partial [Jatrophihabitans sp.]|uniref:TrmH family RNA methyltransferase n=1 Tax=Jatrophihabitans sp. TaxID=1932789 RepID=UPI003F7D569E